MHPFRLCVIVEANAKCVNHVATRAFSLIRVGPPQSRYACQLPRKRWSLWQHLHIPIKIPAKRHRFFWFLFCKNHLRWGQSFRENHPGTAVPPLHTPPQKCEHFRGPRWRGIKACCFNSHKYPTAKRLKFFALFFTQPPPARLRRAFLPQGGGLGNTYTAHKTSPRSG